VPKSYLPNYREFYERRQFAPASQAISTSLRLLDQDVPFGSRLLFAARDLPGFVVHLEVCEDLWVPLPPSTLAALAGATVLANLSRATVTVGKADYRRLLVPRTPRSASPAACIRRRPGESTTDLAWTATHSSTRTASARRVPALPKAPAS